MITFLAIYRGQNAKTAEMIAATNDPDILAYVAQELLENRPIQEDPILEPLEAGRREALRLIAEGKD